MEKLKINNPISISQERINQLNEELENQIETDQELHDYIYSLTTSKEVIRKSYPAIRRYLLSKEKCYGCKKLSNCPYKNKGIIKELKYDQYTYELEDHFCKCDKAKDVDKVLSNIIYSDVDINSSYYLYTEIYALLKTNGESNIKNSFKKVGKEVYKGILQYNRESLNNGFYIVSDNSNGNNLAISATFFASKNLKIKCSIIDAKLIFTDLSNINQQVKNEAKQCLDKALEADLICIINLGFEYKNQAVVDSIIMPLFIELKRKGKMIIISSYYNEDELISNYFYKNNKNREILKGAFNNIVEEKTIEDLDQF